MSLRKTMKKNDIQYTLRMSSVQCRTALKAVELLMRLKLKQEDQIPYCVLDIGQKDYCERRDNAEPYLRMAFNELFPKWEDVKKDDEWYRLYNLYQVMRYQVHLAENPSGTGVDSYPPMKYLDEDMPECTYTRALRRTTT